jgi:hypothetical protein
MCNLYSITTSQAAIIALFRVINRYVGNLPPMPGVFPDYPAPVVPLGRGATAEDRWTARHQHPQHGAIRFQAERRAKASGKTAVCFPLSPRQF